MRERCNSERVFRTEKGFTSKTKQSPLTPNNHNKASLTFRLQQTIVLVAFYLPCASKLLPTQPLTFACVVPIMHVTLGLCSRFGVCFSGRCSLPFFFLDSFQGSESLDLLVVSWFLEVNRFVQLLVLVVHGLPFQSIYKFVDGLANFLPILVHERWLPFTILHIRCVDERAQHTFFATSQRHLFRSFTNHRIREVRAELGLHHGKRFLCFSPSLQS